MRLPRYSINSIIRDPAGLVFEWTVNRFLLGIHTRFDLLTEKVEDLKLSENFAPGSPRNTRSLDQ